MVIHLFIFSKQIILPLVIKKGHSGYILQMYRVLAMYRVPTQIVDFYISYLGGWGDEGPI